MKHKHIQVLIIGAGPSGLMMACQLARLGISFRIIDKNAEMMRESRALAIQARSLEIFQQMDLAQQAIAKGVKMNNIVPILNGKVATKFSFEKVGKSTTAFPFVLMLEQYKTEALLLDYLRKKGIEIEREMKLLQLQEKNDEVTATLRRAYGGIEEITADWVIGADGAGSTVRHSLGFSFHGATYQRTFALADVEVKFAMSNDNPYDSSFHLLKDSLIANLYESNFIAFFPMKGKSRYRMMAALPEELSEEVDQTIAFERIQSNLENNGYFNFKMKDCQWFSIYKIHHRCVEQFRKGRCFLVGDAAHIHSPLGSQGMNNGFQDAYNLAWKLAFVIKGHAQASLLDTYHAERHPVARQLFQTNDALFSIVINNKPLVQFAKYRIAPVVLKWLANNLPIGRLLFRLLSQTAIHYKNSHLSVNHPNIPIFHPKIRAGERVPYCQIKPINSKEKTDIYQLFTDTHFHLLLFVMPDDTSFQKKVQQLENRLQSAYDVSFIRHTIFKTENEAAFRKFGVKQSTLFLIRPDVYIAYRSTKIRFKSIQKFLTYHLNLKDKNETFDVYSVQVTAASM